MKCKKIKSDNSCNTGSIFFFKLRFIIFILICSGMLVLQAQENTTIHQVIPAAGGEATGDGGSASYSVGQTFYKTTPGTDNHYIAEGVQQPFEISIETGIEEALGINLIISAYPNPAQDFLILRIDNTAEMLNYEVLRIQFYDLNGKLLVNKKVNGNSTNIDMSLYVPGTYFLKVIEGKREVKVFKVIKN